MANGIKIIILINLVKRSLDGLHYEASITRDDNCVRAPRLDFNLDLATSLTSPAHLTTNICEEDGSKYVQHVDNKTEDGNYDNHPYYSPVLLMLFEVFFSIFHQSRDLEF